MTRKILITTSSFAVEENHALAELAASGLELVRNPHGRRLSEDEATDLLKDDQVIGMIAGVEPLTARVLEAAPTLRVISRCGAGLDSVDVAAATDCGIEVLNTPVAPAQSTAELTLGLIISVARRLAEADRSLRSGNWAPLQGRLLGASTIGVIGAGHVGTILCRLLGGFGGNVLVYDPGDVPTPPGTAHVSFETLLETSDIVSVHVPLGAATLGLVSNDEIARMKPGAIIVNAARGGIVNEAAVAAAITSGHLGGAAFDVFTDEPYNGPLTGFDNVVLTAHMGSAARESRRAMEEEAAQNLTEALHRLKLVPELSS